MTDRSATPWVLIRKGKPLVRFASLDQAQRLFDQQRFNSAIRIGDAAIFGTAGEAWYCQGTRWAKWERDDERRRRYDPVAELGESTL